MPDFCVLNIHNENAIQKKLGQALARHLHATIQDEVGSFHRTWRTIEEQRPNAVLLDGSQAVGAGLTILRMLLVRHPVPVYILEPYGGIPPEIRQPLTRLDISGIFPLPESEAAGEIDTLAQQLTEYLEPLLHLDELPTRSTRRLMASPPRIPSSAIPASAVPDSGRSPRYGNWIIAIGTSAGGPETLRHLLMQIPENTPPILITQHMPAKFTEPFSKRLNRLCPMEVLEGTDEMAVKPGRCIIAPGGKQMSLRRSGGRFAVECTDGPPVCGHRPSVDVLFRSVADAAAPRAIGVMLTGMGADGADALCYMREKRCRTFAQDQETSLVFGMPKEAIRRGGAEQVLPLDRIAASVLGMCEA